MIYADASFLISAYTFEPDSEPALRAMARIGRSLFFTPFQRHEVRTAIRRKVFLGQMTDEEVKFAFRDFDSDLRDEILLHVAIPWTEAFRQADSVGESEGQKLGVRSSDLLHVGIALALEAENFWTFDTTQRALAKAAGLNVKF